MAISCNSINTKVEVYETSESGNLLHLRTTFEQDAEPSTIELNSKKEFQTISGFGGAFTESSAYLLNKMSEEKRNEILAAYFAKDGARYSLARTHMNSCDFSLNNYSYTPVADDKNLVHFSVDEDKDDIIPMIKDAMAISEDGFKLFSSPWTAAPWMKDNNSWVGGKLLPEYYDTWALFFSKY
ncbi:MAG: glycosyl hydrolase family 30, partial [Flavobacteriaceae bacterium]